MSSIKAALADLASQEAPNYGATAKKYECDRSTFLKAL